MRMKGFRLIGRLSLGSLSLLAMVPAFMLSGCIVREHDTVREEPAEGYYDNAHHRWYHEHAWVACDDRDPHCPPVG
jgi:hypothetical protein